jgi:periplasmic protein TonB
MPAPQHRTNNRLAPIAETEPEENNGRWIGWSIYAFLALVGFCFGAWAGNQKPKTIEIVKNVPAENKPEPKPPEKREAEKKEPVIKAPEPMVIEPKPNIEPKIEPKPAPKIEPKPAPNASPEPKKPATVTAVSFEKEVLPIFRSKCWNCHGAVGKPKGGLDLRTLASIAKGGDNGDALKGGDLKNSLIWASIEDGAMPPADRDQLSDAEKMKIKNWILSGGK